MSQSYLNVLEHWQQYLKKSDPFAEIMNVDGEVYRDVPGRQTLKVVLKDKSYYIKKHFGVGWKEILKNYLFLRKPVIDASNEEQALAALFAASIKAPRVIASGSDGAPPYCRRSFIVLEDMSERESLETIVLRYPEFFKSIKKKRHWIKILAKVVKRMHDNGINHRDLYLCHFLVPMHVEYPEAADICLIDLHRAAVRESVPNRWIIKDLAALYFSSWPIDLSQRDKLYFIKCYSDCSLRNALQDKQSFWKKIQKRAEFFYREFKKKYPRNDYPKF